MRISLSHIQRSGLLPTTMRPLYLLPFIFGAVYGISTNHGDCTPSGEHCDSEHSCCAGSACSEGMCVLII
ncbi:uncharacterized protein BDW47DRAFT_112577 [Aspergillus candidus]|uniref:Uncharacterized protein n=1 Tax=Aspergillus candidus TaxID=41067 RepID=A0A2I2F0S8_ASPCN|nr:hypothetical protein BDW47DRAFT_112577 [Aspergillus candidus]PLB34229.1 hypothetical protein BDW47DRAFT_112577 [Aspergillus candidus]